MKFAIGVWVIFLLVAIVITFDMEKKGHSFKDRVKFVGSSMTIVTLIEVAIWLIFW